MARKVFQPTEVTTGPMQPDGYCTAEHDTDLCVYGALPGERLVAMPFTRKRRKFFARPTELINTAPDRVAPQCDVADICGGCSLQHMDAAAQVAFKQAKVKEVFADTVPAEWYSPILGDVFGYRAKARLGVKYVDKKQQVLVGFREQLKPYIVDTRLCHVLRPPAQTLPTLLSQLIGELSLMREIPQVEVAMGDDSLALVFRHLAPLVEDDLAKLEAFGRRHDIQIFLQSGNADTLKKFFPIDGETLLEYQLPEFDLRFKFAPLDFIQVNASINGPMVARAVELLDLNATDSVLDAFCGIGNFSLAIARSARSVTGIEGSRASVERAGYNAQVNHIDNACFVTQDLFDEGLEIESLQKVNKVLLDPPRSGAEALCKRLASHKVEKVVYVSCNPVTLARDAKILVANGYRFDGAGVIDMFPHTTHIESIASFSN